MKRLFYILTLIILTAANLLVAEFAFAQVPVITSFEPKKASYGEIITIHGSGFSPKADLKVSFGAVAGNITESNGTTIKVTVPAGAIYEPISVTNIPSELIAYTSQPFLLSFGGLENGNPLFEPYKKYAVPSTQELYDVCACDLNGDGKPELVGSNNSSTGITIYPNSGSPGTINFSAPKSDINLGIKTEFLSCGDLNGDGKTDLVFSGSGIDLNKLVFLQNTSSTTTGTISFATPKYLLAQDYLLGKPVIQDLDGDGKPEITLTNQIDNKIFIFKNTSSAGITSFDPAFLSFLVSEETSDITYGLRLKDVNKDGLVDITASSYYEEKVFFLINKSTPGNFAFEQAQQVIVPNGTTNHELEDLDGDGKMDLITTEFFSNKINILLNNSSDGSLSFAPAFALPAGRPLGLQLGDLNGDKKFDILVGDNNTATATGFINTSTAGNLSFKTVLFTDALSTTAKFANVQIADLDGDAKPDAIAADRVNGVFYTFRNLTCIYPAINPAGTVNICEGSSVTLSTIQSPSSGGTPRVSYEWFKDGASVGTSYSLEVTSAGSYHVNMNSVEGCSATSSNVTVNLFSESLGSPTFDPVSAACAGDPLTLSVSPAIDGATYTWTNKNTGFTTTTTTNSVTFAQADPAIHSGIYEAAIVKNCQIEVESPQITINPKPTISSITVEGSLSLCAGESRILRIEEGYATYEWKKDGAQLQSGTSASFTATTPGSYTVVVKNQHGCAVESGAITLQSSGTLTAAFEGPVIACVNQPVQFTDQTSGEAGKVITYLWDFGDGTQSTDQFPTHTYSDISNSPYTVSLSVKYEGENCLSTKSYSLAVTTTPAITIEALGPVEFCEGDSVKVQLNGDIAGATWSNGDTGLFTYAKQNGLLQAEILTTAGCTTTKALEFFALAGPEIEISADQTEIGRGDSTYLQASGGISYIWEPAESLDYPTISNPLASPEKTTTYKVRAMGENGCSTVKEITITVDLTFRVEAPKLFVPSTDQSWKVQKVENYPEVSLTIINKFGKPIFTAHPYQNNWDGTDHGQQLNDGVYFYIFKDPSGNIVKTGSITLVR